MDAVGAAIGVAILLGPTSSDGNALSSWAAGCSLTQRLMYNFDGTQTTVAQLSKRIFKLKLNEFQMARF
jgi:hypothetical protein